eukprot:502017_1
MQPKIHDFQLAATMLFSDNGGSANAMEVDAPDIAAEILNQQGAICIEAPDIAAQLVNQQGGNGTEPPRPDIAGDLVNQQYAKTNCNECNELNEELNIVKEAENDNNTQRYLSKTLSE